MAQALIRNIDDKVLDAYRSRAAENGRSLEAELRETLMPGTDFTVNPWLFQRLTQTLDRRVMAQIGRVTTAA